MKYLVIVLALPLLAACANEDQVAQTNIQNLKAHCASEGKRFVLKSTDTAPSSVPLMNEVTVTGYCI